MLRNKSEFTKNILTLMTGTAIAQAIPIAISPILTRIYAPEDFGVFALFVAIISILGNIANAKYELAIMLPKKDEDAINIFALGFIITCMITFASLILVIVFNEYFTNFLGNEAIRIWLYFVPIALFFTGMFNILNYFNNRRKNYKDLRNAIILKSIVLSIVQIIVGFVKSGASGLISGQILSNMFANMKLARNILKDKILVSKIRKEKIIALAKRYKNFPKYNLPSSFADTFSQQLPFFFITKFFSLSINGYFSFAQKIISLPSSFIAKSISQVFFQKISENRNRRIRNLYILKKTIIKLFIIILPISTILFLFAPTIFTVAFGKEWIKAGEIAKYLSVSLIIIFISSTLSVTLIVYEKLKILAIWQYFYLLSIIMLFIICYYFKFIFEDFLLLLIILESILYSIYLYLIYYTIKKEDEKL